jgi:predicted DNA-binding protein with PD1-like motif
MFGGGKVEEIVRIRLDRGDLLLESIEAAVKKFGIQDGAVVTAAGSLQQCTFHAVGSLAAKPEQRFTTRQGPMEILNINGIIAGGEPHLHMTLGAVDGGAFGGHLEKGCKVLYPNQEGVPVMQRK